MRILVVILDAAERGLIEAWMQDGSLPNLRELRSRGVYGRLESTAGWLSGSPWPTFYTATMPNEHGLYHFLQWRSDNMAMERPNPEWLPLRPFWRELATEDRRAVVVDLPMAYAPEAFHGVEISGYATHDHLDAPAAYPPDAMEWVRARFGSSRMQEEIYGPQRIDPLLALRDELLEATGKVASAGEALMAREDWSLFMIAFTGTHRGGHKLWDASGVRGRPSPAKKADLARSLHEVYRACDEALGRLVRSAGRDTTVLALSLHGMGPNTSRVEVLDTMLQRILEKHDGNNAGRPKTGGLLHLLRDRVPVEWRHTLKRRFPTALQDKLSAYWRLGRVDWAATRAVSLVADNLGYIRLNLRGRERMGIVDPGEEYDRLCRLISEGLETFVDVDSGEPVVDRIATPCELYGQGPRAALLPDLLVRWARSPASGHRWIESSLYGRIPWPTPGIHPSGRSGNHRSEGFLVAAGPHIQAGGVLGPAHIIDIAPTLYALFGLRVPSDVQGRALTELLPVEALSEGGTS